MFFCLTYCRKSSHSITFVPRHCSQHNLLQNQNRKSMWIFWTMPYCTTLTVSFCFIICLQNPCANAVSDPFANIARSVSISSLSWCVVSLMILPLTSVLLECNEPQDIITNAFPYIISDVGSDPQSYHRGKSIRVQAYDRYFITFLYSPLKFLLDATAYTFSNCITDNISYIVSNLFGEYHMRYCKDY